MERFKKIKCCKIRIFSKMIGKLVSVCPGVKYGYLYTKLFEREKYLALKKSRGDSLEGDLNWWIENLKHSRNFLKRGSFIREIFSDASNTEEEKTQHINYLELLAVYFGLKCYANDLENCSILCRVNNTTAIAYINRMGSWCERRNIFIFASYIRSSENFEANKASRCMHVDTEWALADSCFQMLTNSFGFPDIDLFASRVNKKCETYVSWHTDPYASAVDAFTIDWSGLFLYVFPPFSVILRTLEKIIADKAQGILVVPMWPNQPWYPTFMSLLVDSPLIFKPKHDLFSFGRLHHPLSAHLSLMGGLLSGKRCS
nr:unnamed protein product [Callosobruchus chinensis]